MDFKFIDYHIEGRVGYLYLNRPDVLNSFHEAMHIELAQLLDQWNASTQIKVIVISGVGRGFCAGQDLSQRDPAVISQTDFDAGASLDKFYNPLILKISQSSKIILAAVNGVAAGAGANIALACDIVVAKQSASFIQSFSKVGLIPDAGGTWFLPRLVGFSRAKALCLLGNKLTAQQALEWGAIWAVYADDTFNDEVKQLAQALAARPSSSLSLIKQAFAETTTHSLAEQLDCERKLQKEAGQSSNYREGVTAFMEKRQPVFDSNL